MLRIFISSLLVSLGLSLPAQAQYFGLVGSAATPSLGACGAGATLAAGSIDHIGTINVGTGLVTSCTLNFSTTLVGTARCVISPYGLATSPVMLTKTVTQAGFNVTFLLSVPGAAIDYTCYIN